MRDLMSDDELSGSTRSRDRGTGALGAAVLIRSCRQAPGATCRIEASRSIERFPLRGHERISFDAVDDLADETAVTRYYEGLEGFVGLDTHRRWLRLREHRTQRQGAADEPDRDESRLGVFCSRSAALTLRRLKSGGRIVNVAARQALEPRLGSGSVAYTIAKAGVAALTTALGAELAGEGILVNAVAPSIMDTPANRKDMPDADFAAWPKVEDVAATILFLASAENTVTRGAIVPVYGRA